MSVTPTTVSPVSSHLPSNDGEKFSPNVSPLILPAVMHIAPRALGVKPNTTPILPGHPPLPPVVPSIRPQGYGSLSAQHSLRGFNFTPSVSAWEIMRGISAPSSVSNAVEDKAPASQPNE